MAVRHHQLVRCVHGRLHRHVALQLAQRFLAVVLLGQVRQMEERRERAHHHLRLVDRQRVDELDGLAERPRALGVGRGDALGVGGLVCGDGARVALVRPDHAVEQTVEESADGRIVLLEHLSLHAEEQHEVVAQALGDLDLRVGFDSLGGVRRAQMTVEGKGCSAFEIGHDASCSWKMRQRDGPMSHFASFVSCRVIILVRERPETGCNATSTRGEERNRFAASATRESARNSSCE